MNAKHTPPAGVHKGRHLVKSTAIAMAEEHGLINLTCEGLSARLGCLPGTFIHVNGGSTFTELVAELMAEGHTGHAVELNRHRVNSDMRRLQILSATLEYCKSKGLRAITRRAIAGVAKVSTQTTHKHFPTLEGLEAEVVGYAVTQEVAPVIAEAITRGHDVPEASRALAAQYLGQ